MGRKPRSDSKLNSLPEDQRVELRDQLLAGANYESCLSWLQDECEVSSTLSAMSAFYKRHCKPVLKDRLKFASLKAEVLIEESGRTDWNEAISEKLRQAAFELISSPGANQKEVCDMLKLFLKSQDQELHSRRVKILEDQARKAEETKAALEENIAKGGVSSETLEVMERALNMLS